MVAAIREYLGLSQRVVAGAGIEITLPRYGEGMQETMQYVILGPRHAAPKLQVDEQCIFQGLAGCLEPRFC